MADIVRQAPADRMTRYCTLNGPQPIRMHHAASHDTPGLPQQTSRRVLYTVLTVSDPGACIMASGLAACPTRRLSSGPGAASARCLKRSEQTWRRCTYAAWGSHSNFRTKCSPYLRPRATQPAAGHLHHKPRPGGHGGAYPQQAHRPGAGPQAGGAAAGAGGRCAVVSSREPPFFIEWWHGAGARAACRGGGRCRWCWG